MGDQGALFVYASQDGSLLYLEAKLFLGFLKPVQPAIEGFK